MKAVLDLRWVRSDRVDGIGRFSLGLTQALARVQSGLTVLYHQDKMLPILRDKLGDRVTYQRVPFDILTPADFIRLPGFLRSLGTTIYLTPNFPTSIWHRGYRMVVIVNDLIPFLYPQSLNNPSLGWRAFFMTKIPTTLILKKAAAILTISESSKKDLQEIFQVPQDKITVIYPGFDVEPVKPGQPRHILYLGRMEPYKNLDQLIRSYAALTNELRNKFDLVLAGQTKEPYYSELRKLASDLGVGERVKFLGYVHEDQISELFSHAAVFAYPSRYEGFGLPVVEARLRCVPVVTSRSSSLPEAAGGGALLVDPDDIHELTEAMRRLLTEPAIRAQLLSQNKDIGQQFSWEKSAEVVLNLFKKLND